jgi:hypothetical protein
MYLTEIKMKNDFRERGFGSEAITSASSLYLEKVYSGHYLMIS